MAYAEAARAQISASIKYRSLKFSTLPNANANDIARALLFRVQLDELEAIQQDPGKGNWSIILKSISMAKSSLNVGLLCTGTGIELHCFTQAGFPGARIATQPLTLEEVVLTKGKKSIFTVMSSATFVLNVLISSNLTTLKILRAVKPALALPAKTTPTL